ncbi:Cof-type HAD-IIB family hydrolase [Streptococcus moroccensis]|uniref:Cof subfamily protein (Haloacid dehalogenase superfamily) n=1 Tax=Streptococcus moroccensis TaxID=1451356 RepID=A0ABT9YSZ7_9STRE|nr:Cof-type HAD-IIB family hydrolase [Streptococcus moroccensis]MDQ0223103.1 Cof subfamily protein (haloacid dehalogenase superfamily) [Streptococcus moroccensis]
MKTDKKLIAIDLDGTLLNSQSQLSQESIDTVKKVAALGHQVVIATGRPYRMAKHYYDELGMTGPMINFNGSLMHIPGKRWAFEHERILEKEIFLDIVKREEEWKADFIAGEFRKSFYVTHTNREAISPSLFAVEKIEDGSELKPEKVTKAPNVVLMQTRHPNKMTLAREMEDIYQQKATITTWGGPMNILECTAEGVHKAYALKHLLKALNMDRSQLIAFGDEVNDDEMLDFAQTSYAMKNANPELLPHADHQLDYTNDENGVARKLAELFL